MTVQTVPYEHMSKANLIEIIEHQKTVIARFYRLRSIPNKVLSPGEKFAWDVAKQIISNEKPNEKGFVRAPIDKIAEKIGMSGSSASRYITNICQRFDAAHETEEYTTLKGQKCNLTYVKPNDLIWTCDTPDELPLPEEKERAINGNGKQCPRCNTNNLQIKTRRITYQEIQECDCCGYKKVMPVITDNLPLDEMEYIPEKKGVQTEEPFEEKEKALTSASLTNPITTQEESEYEKAFQTEEPFSIEDFLQQRIGHGSIIVSTGSVENTQEHPKYYTKPAEYMPDIKAYLRGDLKHIYGSRPALPDETTYLLGFDLDTAGLDKSHKYMMYRLALAGLPSVYWKRRPGRGHLEIYTDRPVDRKAFYAHCVRVCPDLVDVPEVFPIGSDQNTDGDDRSDYGYSWPLYYRIDNKVIECSAEFMFPDQPGELVTSKGYKSDRAGLEHLLSQVIVDAAIIPAASGQAKEEPAKQTQHDVLLLDKPLNRLYREGDDLKPIVLDEWNRTHSWDEVIDLCGGVQKNKHFLAVWRGEHTASVKVDSDGRYACDYGKPGNFPKKLDKFGVYCLAQGIDQKYEMNRLCAEYRQRSQQERRAS